MCSRRFTAQWGDCEKSQIVPLNTIIIIIIIIVIIIATVAAASATVVAAVDVVVIVVVAVVAAVSVSSKQDRGAVVWFLRIVCVDNLCLCICW